MPDPDLTRLDAWLTTPPEDRKPMDDEEEGSSEKPSYRAAGDCIHCGGYGCRHCDGDRGDDAYDRDDEEWGYTTSGVDLHTFPMRSEDA